MNLKINGKDYPLQFGIGAIEIYCDKMDCDIEDIDAQIFSKRTIDKLRAINTLALCALQNGCESANPVIKFDLTYRDFQNWLDTQDQDVANQIIAHWKKSKTLGIKVSEYYFGELMPDELESETPKKKTKTKPQSAK